MAIKRIKVTNFKSFKELDLELGQFNVLIGANASGKSNFTEIFKFLRDLPENSLEDAFLRRGGLQSLLNLKISDQSDFTMQVEVQYLKDRWWPILVQSTKLKVVGIDYSFALGIKRNEFFIKSDKLKQVIKPISLNKNDKRQSEINKTLGDTVIVFYNSDGKQGYDINPTNANTIDLLGLGNGSGILSLLFSELESEGIPSRTLFINIPNIFIRPWDKPFENIAIYDFDPHKAKNPTQITGKAELHEDGSNLAMVLNRLLDDQNKKRMLCNLIKDLLPFVEDIGTEKFSESSILMKLRENYYKDDYLRAYMLSDGTINLTAMLVALYFEEKDLIIVEEPERNIHPHLISRVLSMMKEASNEKQIIITTHSPEVVKHAGVENVLLVSRDEDGFSVISRPSDKEEVKIFLQNELGLDDLFVQNLLEI